MIYIYINKYTHKITLKDNLNIKNNQEKNAILEINK